MLVASLWPSGRSQGHYAETAVRLLRELASDEDAAVRRQAVQGRCLEALCVAASVVEMACRWRVEKSLVYSRYQGRASRPKT